MTAPVWVQPERAHLDPEDAIADYLAHPVADPRPVTDRAPVSDTTTEIGEQEERRGEDANVRPVRALLR
ncbi:hypothetical protein FB470_000603 [Amycolatopsis thermophila]|uniref:Uncharacterized protein n=1 Tax=Amycolatopsis thermophila TaxID=206084 RepID=A0ABU0EMU1_9PSEU|nr:hypothetical protein [Amycolatopsis thermophila]